MQYLTVKEAAIKWGYCEKTVQSWCRKGLIKITLKAKKQKGRWQIPVDAPCPKKLKSKTVK